MNIPPTMKAVVLVGHGGLDKLEVHTDWPTPTPAAGQVLVRVGACGLNNTDINTRTAWYSKKVTDGITDAGGKGGYDEAESSDASWGSAALTFPRIQGADVSGHVAAVGQGVDPARVGQRVIIDPWLLASGDWLDAARSQYFGSEVDGGYAEYCVVRAENAVEISTQLSHAELATFPCAYTTAENLVARTGLRPGERVVISGASGGVGSAAIQLCRARGARVVAIASAAKAEILHQLGAETVIDRNEPHLVEAIRDASAGGPQVALDVVGQGAFGALIDALAHGGRYSSSGAIAGPMVDFDLRHLVYKDLQLTGATIVPPGTMKRLVGLIEQGALKPLLAQSFPLEQLAQAQEAFMAKRHVGNIVVEC